MNLEAHLQALETELAGYIRHGRTDRAKQVEQELIRLGRPAAITSAVVVPSKSESTPTTPARSAHKHPSASKTKPDTKTPDKKRRL